MASSEKSKSYLSPGFPTEVASLSSRPSITLNIIVRSLTSFAMTPGWSKVFAIDAIPNLEIEP